MAGIIIVCTVFFVEQRRVLLVQHGEDKFWKFCGGQINDLNASLLETAEKEARDELGIGFELRNTEPFIKDFPIGDRDRRIDMLSVNYWGKRIGEIVQAEKIKKIQWASLDKLYEIPRAPNVVPALEHFHFRVDQGISQNIV